MSYTVVKDTRERKGWIFPKTSSCVGMVEQKLNEGDYSILGLETQVIIERKGIVAEFAQNITQDRFTRELERLDKIIYPFILLEFTLDDVMKFPVGSGIPKSRWKRLRVTPTFIIKRINEIIINHNTQIIFCGKHGQMMADSIFRRVLESINDGKNTPSLQQPKSTRDPEADRRIISGAW